MGTLFFLSLYYFIYGRQSDLGSRDADATVDPTLSKDRAGLAPTGARVTAGLGKGPDSTRPAPPNTIIYIFYIYTYIYMCYIYLQHILSYI